MIKPKPRIAHVHLAAIFVDRQLSASSNSAHFSGMAGLKKFGGAIWETIPAQ
jgi:hypothetical protein